MALELTLFVWNQFIRDRSLNANIFYNHEILAADVRHNWSHNVIQTGLIWQINMNFFIYINTAKWFSERYGTSCAVMRNTRNVFLSCIYVYVVVCLVEDKYIVIHIIDTIRYLAKIHERLEIHSSKLTLSIWAIDILALAIPNICQV